MENREEQILKDNFLKSNVIDKENAMYQIKSTLNFISETVAKTLGPYGSNTIIQDKELNHFLTKDGYNVLKKIYFYYDLPKTVLDIVKKISRNLVRTVGDGSTSSIVIANALFENVYNISDRYNISPQDIINILEEINIIMEDYIKKEAIQITPDNFEDVTAKIASLAVNNNEYYGKLICNIFKEIGQYGFINMELSNSTEDSYEVINGIEIKNGFIDQLMTTNDTEDVCEYNDVNIFMCNDQLSDNDIDGLVALLTNICIERDEPLLIIANGYSDGVAGFLHANLMKAKTKKPLPLVAIQMDGKSKKGRERFNDIKYILDCKPYDKLNGDDIIEKIAYENLGKCKSINVTEMNTQIIDGKGYNTENTLERKQKIEDEYNLVYNSNGPVDRDSDLFELRKRLSFFSPSVAKLYIGGNSQPEKETKQFLIEDAIFACRSAFEHGYIIGGNLIIPRIIHRHFDDIIKELKEKFKKDINITQAILEELIQVVDKSFKTSFSKILENASISHEQAKIIIKKSIETNQIYNVKYKEFEDISKTKIINSAKTDIEIMKSCSSIIGLLATSNQFITINSIMEKRG